jgi:methylated-DNA-[protein]-cysteine S-methyltransferase
MYYYIFPTAFGYAGILFAKKPFLVKRVFLPHSKKSLLKRHILGTGPATAARTREAYNLCQDIQAYFNGSPLEPPWRLLDLSSLTPLQLLALEAVSAVPRGSTLTYGQIAEQIGRPRACRFVGTTLARNPFPVLIPCHRIVRANGSPGGFSGGTELKRHMLALEKGVPHSKQTC